MFVVWSTFTCILARPIDPRPMDNFLYSVPSSVFFCRLNPNHPTPYLTLIRAPTGARKKACPLAFQKVSTVRHLPFFISLILSIAFSQSLLSFYYFSVASVCYRTPLPSVATAAFLPHATIRGATKGNCAPYLDILVPTFP